MKKRSLKLTTDDGDVVTLSHSEKNGVFTLGVGDDNETIAVSLSRRQTGILMDWLSRLVGGGGINAAANDEEYDVAA